MSQHGFQTTPTTKLLLILQNNLRANFFYHRVGGGT